MRADRTVERNHLRQWRTLIAEYEAVKRGRSTAFRSVRDFYVYHGTCSQTFRKYYNRYRASGLATDLFPRRRGPKNRQKSEAEASHAKEALFKVLHSPPSDFGFNRATWRRADLQQTLKTTGVMLSKRDIQSIFKAAGYRWMKAKQVLTSRDPEYRTKLDSVKSILQGLREDEGFFSIDEFGPVAVLKRGGRKLIAPNENATVPQWQKSKGVVIITAALELSTNQVTHFYSDKKNTAEIIKLLDLLLDQNRHLSRLYLSWDAASWHISKQLTHRIASNNVMAEVTGSTRVETAPLPAGAQFLNVVEAVFSGMARAILHNSDYSSAGEAKRAIDRYFSERNAYFREHPKRAGKKIWGNERGTIAFSESSNHKDPRYR
ncbi:IS630 family transposase [Bradyrhizobium australiense]|uniref:IS630 family transposase n=1 Tax=Bradyrhizobium australiense TaxID=2721161 RepID=A0A7Y4GT80_9BRAD|nr:IS630 family transposase [Bradyrhizobium australiense]NOJ40902.1 IS630 family transposase [Bradyrhizobium australiense]